MAIVGSGGGVNVAATAVGTAVAVSGGKGASNVAEAVGVAVAVAVAATLVGVVAKIASSFFVTGAKIKNNSSKLKTKTRMTPPIAAPKTRAAWPPLHTAASRC